MDGDENKPDEGGMDEVFDSDEDEDRESSDFSESSDEEEEMSDTGLTENQNRLLYLVSLYSAIANSEEESEQWIRAPSLNVLIYEGIVAQVLDYDYAPSSMSIENKRSYFNMSQEGRSDVDFLREEELLNGLKLSSKTFQPTTCYQISEKGAELVGKLSKSDRQAVQEMVFAPGTKDLLQVVWDGGEYWLRADGYERQSTVTDTEDVSYVSSAYVPQCLRHGGRPTLSNAHRAHECGISDNNIRDELDEVITLNSVSIIVSEFIPFGANQVVQLNNNLGSTERVQGGFFTALLDEEGDQTTFEVPPGLTSVNILDYSLTRHANFEADIHFPEAPGIVQVEMFGCSLNYTGVCFYGMQVEAVLDRIKDNISLDHLARLLVDVHQDSSKIVDACLSAYQRKLMNIIYLGDAAMRDKVNLIVANEITPHLTAEEYMDKGEYENELKQVIGDTRAAFDISEHDTLVFGAFGLLVAGPNARHHEPLLCSFIGFQALNLFVVNFFTRVFIVSNDIKDVRRQIAGAHMDPSALANVRGEITALSGDITVLEEILCYIQESLDIMPVPPEPPEQAGRSLYARLQIQDQKDALLARSMDLVKNVKGVRNEMELTTRMTDIVAEERTYLVHVESSKSLRDVVAGHSEQQRTANTLEMMQIILSGSLAFDILDRVTGEWTTMASDWMRGFVEPMIKSTPAVWFVTSMFFWLILAIVFIKILHNMAWKSAGVVTIRKTVNRLIYTAKLDRYLLDKELTYEEHEHGTTNEIVKIGWKAKDKREWGGASPHIGLTYDATSLYLLEITITYPRRLVKKSLQFSAELLLTKVTEMLERGGVFQSRKEESSAMQGAITFGNRPDRGDVDHVAKDLEAKRRLMVGGEDEDD